MEQVVSVGFEGFGDAHKKIGLKTQPPIVDKNGKPYDLDDPIFPVVKDHEFRVNYWAMPKTAPFMLRYMDEHWTYFNKTRFHGKLTKPNFGLLKDVDAKRMKLRGHYIYGTPGLIELSPNLFNAPHEGWINRILIHEMCHQYVFETYGLKQAVEDGAKTKGHGILWQQAMHMAGLPASRFDDQGNEMYFDKKEMKKHKEFVDRADNTKLLKETRAEYHPMTTPAFGDLVLFVLNVKRVIGCVVCRSMIDPGWYVVAMEPGTGKYIKLMSGYNMFIPRPEDIEGVDKATWTNEARYVLEYANKVRL